MKEGFTLAEVLITLAIVGVVAAITIPSLVTKINSKIETNQIKVIESKLINGLNLLNAEGGINNTYSSTSDFVNSLSKHLKMVKKCDSTNLEDCLPYKSIKNFGNDSNISIRSLDTGVSIGLYDVGFEDTAAFILGDGTPFIVSYNKNCISEEDKVYKSIHPCIAGLYDINGSRKPNRFGINIEYDSDDVISNIQESDIKSFNGAKVGCVAKLGDFCLTHNFFHPEVATMSCADLKTNFSSVLEYCLSNDYWAGALQRCYESGGRLPNESEAPKLAKYIYGNLKLIDYRQIPTSCVQYGGKCVGQYVGIENPLAANTPIWLNSRQYHNPYAFASRLPVGSLKAQTFNRYDDSAYGVCMKSEN